MTPRIQLSLTVLALSALVSGCAQTVLYSPSTGRRLASFQADMAQTHYAGGGVTWDASTVSHSNATLAQGSAAANVIGATGSAVSGAMLAAGGASTFARLIGAALPAATSVAASKPAALQAH